MKQNIVHAGGRIGVHTYTNSVEAVLRSIAIGEKMIELDCVRLADGFGFAHDGVEKEFYNETTRAFHKMPLDQFSQLRVFNKYTPMTLYHLRDMMMIANDIIPVIDFKGSLNEFDNLLDHVKSEFRQYFHRICFQVYDIEWTETLVSKGGRVGLPALWKFYDADPFSEAAIAFLSHSAALLPSALGVSLRWQNPVTKKRNLDAPNFLKI